MFKSVSLTRRVFLALALALCGNVPLAAAAPTAVAPVPSTTAMTTQAASPATSPELALAQKRLQEAKLRIQTAKDLLKNGSATLASIKEKLDAPLDATQNLDGLDVSTLETLRQQILTELQNAQTNVQNLRDAVSQAGAANIAPPAPAPPSADANAPAAQQALIAAQAAASEAENEAYNLEISSQPIALQLARAQLELAQKLEKALQDRLSAIDARLESERILAARATLQGATSIQMYAAYPALQKLAESNESLAQTLIQLTERLTNLNQEREQITEKTAAMKEEMDSLVHQLEQFGFGPIMGNLLLEKSATLPSANRRQRQSQDNRALLETLQSVEVKLRQEREAMRDSPALTQQLLDSLDTKDQQTMRPEVEKLVETRHTIFTSIENIKSPILQAIASIEYALKAQQHVVKAYKTFIAQNLLWLPNERPVWSQPLAKHWNGLLASLTALNVNGVLSALLTALQTHIAPTSLLIFVLLGLLALRKTLHARLQAVVDSTHRPDFRVWSSALHAILLALLLALPIPLALWSLGMMLNTSPLALHGIVGSNLVSAAWVWLNASLFLVLVRPNGLAETMFNWSPRALVALRSAFYLLMYVAIPLDFMASISLELASALRNDAGGGQLLLMLLLFVLAFIIGRMLHPNGAFMRHWRAEHPTHWLSHYNRLTFFLAIGMPLFFALMAAGGYTYSARVLTQTFTSSLWLMLGLILIGGCAKISLQRAYQHIARLRRQREQQNSQQNTATAESETDAPPSVEEVRDLDIGQIAAQSRKLLSFSLLLAFVFALYFVWAPVLPALTLLDNVNLWSVNQVVNGETISSAVSLGDALLTFVLLLALWVAARNLPGLMEIMLEQWTTHNAGTRYAITTIVRYIIISASIVILLGGLGVQWSQLQWLVAALGVGLGFGLQEIFANFVSGIIILLERPVRVGDLVTIGTQTGTIRRIHMRATVLEDFDRKEIVVPNKMLITQEVTNWTLSDTTTRVVVDIGVAYGCDTRKVEALLLEAARRVPRLLTDPAPLVWFMGFGDSALNFRVRAFVGDTDVKQSVTSELNYAIEKILRENDISIPFPQRDVHIPGLEELSAVLKDTLTAQPAAHTGATP